MTVPRYLQRLTPVPEAIEAVKKHVQPVTEKERLPVWMAVGRVLAEDLITPHDFPPRPRAAYDGYAVRSEDTPGRLRVVGEATIGKIDIGFRVEPGTAAYVSTGAYLPEGADTVVPEEAVRREGDYIVVDKHFQKWKNIDPVGSYVKRGQRLLPRGYVLTMLDAVGLLDVAVTEATVYRRVRVGIVATGTEIFEPRDPAEARERILRGEVAETTAKLVEHLVNRYTPWTEVVWRVLFPDDIDAIAWWLERQARGLDLVIMTGGTGPSNVDPFYQLAERLGGKVIFRGLFVKGGRPTSAMLLPTGGLLIALSGHPVSAMHGFIRLVYHVLKYMGGAVRAAEPPLQARARLAAPIRAKRPQPVKVKLRVAEDGALEAEPLPLERQLSSVTVSNVEADAVAITAEAREYQKGEWVPVHVYREPEGYRDN